MEALQALAASWSQRLPDPARTTLRTHCSWRPLCATAAHGDRLVRTMHEAMAEEALCLKRSRQLRDHSPSSSISLGSMSDPALTENEADDGQAPTSNEQAKEWGRDLATLRDHAKRSKKVRRAERPTVPWAVPRSEQLAAERDAPHAAEAMAAHAREPGTAVAKVSTGLASIAALASPANNASSSTRNGVRGNAILNYDVSDTDDDLALECQLPDYQFSDTEDGSELEYQLSDHDAGFAP